jgi:hypothetical protein
MLPTSLSTVLQDLGYMWPEADETQLLQMGQSWTGFLGRIGPPVTDAHSSAQQVSSANQGQAIDAFQQAWNHPQGPHANLQDGTTGATGIGIGLMACAGIVLALKINVIVELVTLAIELVEAIAMASVTDGASLLEVPVFKEIAAKLINLAITLAMNAIMGQ